MVKAGRRLVIDNEAGKQLKELYSYIRTQSLQNAENVRNGLIASFRALLSNPERHPPDKFRLKNDGSYRAYELFSYRISYQVQALQVNIIRIRHVKMNPLYW